MGSPAALRAPPGGRLTPPAKAEEVQLLPELAETSYCRPEIRNTGLVMLKDGEVQRGKARDASKG